MLVPTTVIKKFFAHLHDQLLHRYLYVHYVTLDLHAIVKAEHLAPGAQVAIDCEGFADSESGRALESIHVSTRLGNCLDVSIQY